MVGGRAWYHHEDNVVATAGWINQAANTWLKSNLQAVRDAYALVNAADPKAQLINYRLDHLMAIRTKYPHDKEPRLTIDMDDANFTACRDEMTVGVLNTPNDVIPYSIWYHDLSNPTWTREDRQRFNTLIQQMFDRKKLNSSVLTRSGAGAPWPWRPDHMPPSWSWAKLEAHMKYHFNLMDIWCDKHFVTDELPEQLFLELMWQWIDNGGGYARWNIQATAYGHHAFGWAIGHLHHGHQMLTGWPRHKLITHINQRDEPRCNVLIEPRIWNFMKMDYAEDTYDTILAELRLLKDETEWSQTPHGKVPRVHFREHAQDAIDRSMQFVPARR